MGITAAGMVVVPVILGVVLIFLVGSSSAVIEGHLDTLDNALPTYDPDHVFVIWNATAAWYTGGNDWLATIPDAPFAYIGSSLGALSAKATAVVGIGGEILNPQDFEVVGVSMNSGEIPMLYVGLGVIFFTGVVIIARGSS